METDVVKRDHFMKVLKPREIVAELAKYIIGQDQAKRSVAIALRNRWRRQQVPPDLRDEIAPKNIIMIGPTGVGKTGRSVGTPDYGSVFGGNRVKAAILYAVRDLRIEEMSVPEPHPGEALVRIRACGVCPSDVRRYTLTGPGGPPRLIGHEWVGEVAALETEETDLSVGDRVAVDWRVICGVCHYCRRGAFNFCLAAEPPRVRGGFGEYGCAPVSNLRRLEPHVTYSEAVFAEPLACCINGMRRSGVDFGRTVVVIGCGPIGLMHVQLARHRGAHVIACDLMPERLEKAREVGAQATICASPEDTVAQVKAATRGFGADAIMIAVGGGARWKWLCRWPI